ncbi:MAG: sulfatase-like hydrolase/transferase [Bacteroidota bacterium]|nr:sulfatase-like hydrolase/transferase [Bacteroidota bacterium]
MKKYYIQSRLLRWLLGIGISFLIIMSLLRIIFALVFKPINIPWNEMRPAFSMGLRYDARIICVLLLPLLVIGSFRHCNPFDSRLSRRIIFWFLGIFIFGFSLFYSSDFAHFSYLSQRLNAQVLNYAEDTSISARMLWQTYPVIKILLGMIIFTTAFLWLIKRLYKQVGGSVFVVRKANRLGWSIFWGLAFAVAIFGRIGQYPLRWSDAFSLRNDFEANTALNPIQSFFSTLNFRNSTYDLKKAKEYYSLMADHLGVQQRDSVALNYERTYKGTDTPGTTKPNIVLVICESFSAYKSSMWGNPLNATPFFDQLCKNGVFFDHCFTPSFGTARGVWATITGIPDVEIPETASRNPAMVDQSTIINDFTGYEKMYFIGGSTSWANIRGLLMNNIDGLHLYEGQDFSASKVDVWGISDKNLFIGANEILDKHKSPFFAVIQTADNHRPYTIPTEDLATFKKESFPTDTLKKYGFESDKELNAFRYADYCIQQFFEAARKKKYFDNTIFVFVGDHGIAGYTGDMFPKSWTEQGLTSEHVPLLFYSPGRLQPGKINNVSSQIDILPTVATIAGIPYHNTALGRNLLDTNALNHPDNLKNCAFIIDHNVHKIGLVTSKWYYQRSLENGKQQLVSVIDNKPVDNSPEQSEKIDSSRRLTEAYFETARYLLFNNKKKKPGK